MPGRQRILPVRREYNRWVANQTLEDYALRFTARSARRWAPGRVAQTAIGAISFLALEAIGGAVTLSYGVANAATAICVVAVILLLTGLPISRYAARYGVDIDLLTRGAGFGYIGSTITSLVYASFTFILFAIEASIMSAALEVCFGIPLPLGYVISAVAVIPLVTHGVTWISRFQLLTQPLWIVLNILPVGFILARNPGALADWTGFAGVHGGSNTLSVLGFGGAASVILALMPQIGEQVDILRFLPERPKTSRRSWYAALFAAGPGWILLGVPKMLFGSLLAVLTLRAGVPATHAAEPGQMYRVAFGYVLPWPEAVLALTAAFVMVSQLKINVMNAYAGSLAWSNFFSRLTHSHPGRVVWLVFNVAIALLLMELGIYRALEETLGLFAVVAVAWLGAIVADLAINKPLGLSPTGIEFKRAHLYDINPVGVGSMALATAVALAAAGGLFGEVARALSPFVALAMALVTAPLIAWATGGRYYLARKPRAAWRLKPGLTCSICQNAFEPDDMAYCPAYAAPICSLCCSLDARCHDLCKPHARMQAQVESALDAVLPAPVRARISPRLVRYAGVLTVFVAVIGLVLYLIGVQAAVAGGGGQPLLRQSLWAAFFILLIVAGVAAWFLVLAQESRRVAQEETARQTTALLHEIEAHRRTDAALQRAKEVAEAANLAKSRYVVGLSHELRTPLNAVLGYAQLLDRDPAIPEPRQRGVKVIRRSAEHLSGLIDGLLDISKIEAGRLQLQHGPVRLDEFLDGLVSMFRLQAEAKGLAFRFTRASTLPGTVRTDEKRLRQVLINLLSNAIKFTATGEVGLHVAYRNLVATLAVTDTGPGIPPGDLGRIFEPFDRGSLAERHTAPGLGLGLTITKLLVEIMGGEIRAGSSPGGGSRFEVRLMLAALDADAKPATRPIHGYAGPRRTVLVVDDDADHQSLMRETLEPLGFALLSARDGGTALSIAADAEPDLVLLDVQMPGMTGWEVARALRERGFAGPIVMLSANVQQGAIQEGVLPLGAPPPGADTDQPHDDLLPKPFELARLLDRIGHHLGLDWIGDEAPPDPQPAGLDDAPPRETVEELLGLARIGYVRGIEAGLARMGGRHRAFAEALGPHLASLDMPALVQTLERSLGEPEHLDG